MSTRLIIRDHNEGIVGVIEDFTEATPREGEFIFTPNEGEGPDATIDPAKTTHALLMVRAVAHGILARPKDGEQHFVERHDKVIVVTV